ncbi:hypothetical protein Rhe02_66800 [Rhizocola hellebori]|uniref:Uncharacterized protein n=1 Tax=Rhizocola hellebori TaxID=1392758 RepID=A0A8J3QCY5_9ACTN|nr:hypothetical protein [Rhizocola hellebori]GIH08613.1 hypothetical protein Rhe02_66800 [Rhizocola hellebori]
MAEEVVVITEAVVDEAAKWRRLAGQMEPIKSSADGLDLAGSAFYIGDGLNFLIYSNSYNDFQNLMVTALGGAVTEFEQIGGALDKIAAAYDQADQIVSLDLNQIWRP